MSTHNRLSAALAQRKLLALFEALDELGLAEPMMESSFTRKEVAEISGLGNEQAELFLLVLQLNDLVVIEDDRYTLAAKVVGELSAGTHTSWLSMLRIERWAHEDHLNPAGIVRALRGLKQDSKIPSRLVCDLAKAMDAGASGSAPQIARVPGLRNARSLADLAGGTGAYSIFMARLSAKFGATVYDRPSMLPCVERGAISAGVADRIGIQTWDLIRDTLPRDHHDAVLISHVLHLLSSQDRASVLARARDALPQGGTLAVHDFTYSLTDSVASPPESSIDWLSAGTGFVLSKVQLEREIASAGFRIESIVDLVGTETTLIVALRV